jgi:hypothetical protein
MSSHQFYAHFVSLLTWLFHILNIFIAHETFWSFTSVIISQVFSNTSEPLNVCHLFNFVTTSYFQHGCATAQAVSRWLPTAAAQVRAWIRSCGICGGRSGTGAGFLRVLRFLLPVIAPTASHSSSSIIWGWYNRPNSGQQSRLSLTFNILYSYKHMLSIAVYQWQGKIDKAIPVTGPSGP